VYDGTSSDTKSRTLGAIALNPTGNSSNDHYFMSLVTGKRIHRRAWPVIPVSDLAISRVEAIALEEDMPLVEGQHMITEYDPDEQIDESAYNKDYAAPQTPEPASDHALTDGEYDTEDEEDDDDGEQAADANAPSNQPTLTAPHHTEPMHSAQPPLQPVKRCKRRSAQQRCQPPHTILHPGALHRPLLPPVKL
jgi:hypothetical protein